MPQENSNPEQSPDTIEDSFIERYNIDFKHSYLVKEQKPVISLNIFNSMIAEGVNGLCITRANPDELRDVYDFQDLPIIWLTRNRIESETCVDPSNITRLSVEISKFIQDTERGAILLEGLEYLISQNNYPVILRFIHLLNDKIMLGNSCMIVPLNPLILKENELHMLERDMKSLP
jgi:two-component system cell cycle response regulator